MTNTGRHSMRCCLLLVAPILLPPQGLAEEEVAQPAAVDTLAQMETDPHKAEFSAWLDEVRAQREAWEAHRDAVKESVGKSPPPPPGAMPEPPLQLQEPPTSRYFQRRDQRLKQSEERREAHRQEQQRVREEREWLWQQYPYGWDTPWYYRGY